MKELIIDEVVSKELTCSAIARKHGVSRQYVHQIAKSIGIDSMRKEKKPDYQRKLPKCPDGMQEQWKRFIRQRINAKTRGIEFKLTFEQWWELWEPHYQSRGQGKMCMCREGDKGAYEAGNVRIDTSVNNVAEHQNLKRQQKEQAEY